MRRTFPGKEETESFFIEVDKCHYFEVIDEGFWSEFPDFWFSRIVSRFVLNDHEIYFQIILKE